MNLTKKTALCLGLLLCVLLTACTRKDETPGSAAPEPSPTCTLTVGESYSAGEPVELGFELHNPTDRTLYVLAWYTPLEGIAGEILQVTRDGQALPYQGMLAKRGDPLREEYVTLAPGEKVSAAVDLKTGYDLSAPGAYQVEFTAGLKDVVDDVSLVPRKRDEHRPVELSCNTLRFEIRE
jgi:hypothetical protein